MKNLLAALLLAVAGSAAAEHITDKMAVGLFDTPNDKTPRRILVTGTPLEILDRAGPLCKVGLGDGDKGWLECRYVSKEKPARAMLLEAQARNAALHRQIRELQQPTDAPAAPQTLLANSAKAKPQPTSGFGLKSLIAAMLVGLGIGATLSLLILRR